MKIHQKPTDIEINKKKHEPWALLRPGKSTNLKRHQAARKHTKKRHLAKINKRLSAHGARRAKKLRTRHKKLLRERQQRANVLSKKVNKNQARTSRPQFEKTQPRVKYNKVTTFCEIKSKITVKKEEFPGLLTVLLSPRTIQVNYKIYSNKYPRNYPYRLIHSGAYKLGPRTRLCPKPLYHRKAKVIKENELSTAKEPHHLNTKYPGYPQVKMNSKIDLGESAEVPATIFESDAETGEDNELPSAQENPARGVPPTQDQQEELPPANTMNNFCCGICGVRYHTPDDVQSHLGSNHGITGNFMFHPVNDQGVTPITGIGFPQEPKTSATGTDCAQERPEVATKAPDHWQKLSGSEKAWFNPSICQEDSSEEEDENSEVPAHGPENAHSATDTSVPPAPSSEEATPGLAPGGEVGRGTDNELAQVNPPPGGKAMEMELELEIDKNIDRDDTSEGGISPLYMDTRPDLYDDVPTRQKTATEKPLETETVRPPPAPSPEVAAPGSAPGGAVGGSTDYKQAQNEPLPKKKALEWERIEDLDHNKVNAKARAKANTAAAAKAAGTVEDRPPGLAPDGARKESPPAKASPGTSKAREAQSQPSQPKTPKPPPGPESDKKPPPRPTRSRNQNQARDQNQQTSRRTTAEDRRKAKQNLPKKQPSNKLPPPVKFPKLVLEEVNLEDEDEIIVISPDDKKQKKVPGKKHAQDTPKNRDPKIMRVATPGSTPHPHSRGGRTCSSAQTGAAGTRKPKRPTDPEPESTGGAGNRKPKRPTDTEPEVIILGSQRKIISREKRTEENGKAWDIAKKNIQGLLRLREKQKVYVTKDPKTGKRGGPDQDAINLQERMLQNHEIVILGEGQAGLVRNIEVPFKARHGEENDSAAQRAKKRQKRKEKEEKGVIDPVPEGQVMHHVRLQKKRFSGKSIRKYTCGFAYELRLARAKQRLMKEAHPPLRKSVRIKPKDGRTPYSRHDPRVEEAVRNIRYEKRTQTPHDKNINSEFNEFVKRSLEDITCVDLGDTDDSETEIENVPTPAKHLKVSLMNFLEAPKEMGNQSGEESDYDEIGTNILIKEESQSEDSEAEGGYCHPNDRKRTRTVSTQVENQTRSTATQYDTGMGSSESTSEEDEAPPTVEATRIARQLVVFEANQTINSDLETAVALFQSLVKSKHKFKKADGTEMTCGVDYLNVNISKDAKVRIKNKQKKKGSGKKSTPGHIIDQDREADVLEIDINNEDKQMVADPPAGPSGGAGGRGRDKSKKHVTSQKKQGDGIKKPDTKRKRDSSKKDNGLKFFHELNTDEDKIAKTDWVAHQLLVLGLSKTHGKRPPPGGPQEIQLNNLVADLSTDRLGPEGIDLTQEDILGATMLEPYPGETQTITRITLATRGVKRSIRKAAELPEAKRWGASTHPVFLRDITEDSRKRKSEDAYLPKKGNHSNTPKKGGDKKRARLETHGRSPPDPRDEELARYAAQRKSDKLQEQKHKEDLIDKIREKQLELRVAKMEHQQSARDEPILTTSQITKFTALNENWTPENPKSRENTEEPETEEECVAVVAGDEKEAEGDQEEPESDPELLRGNEDEENQTLEPDFQSSEFEDEDEDEQELSPSPQPAREVSYTPEKSISKIARKNARRRKNNRIYKETERYEETKKRIGIGRRLGRDKKNPHLRLGPETSHQRRPPTTSTEIQSDSDERAGRRPDGKRDKKKRRRESQDSVEEIDSRGRKVPRDKNKHQRK